MKTSVATTPSFGRLSRRLAVVRPHRRTAILLGLALTGLACAQIAAGLALRGLYADGAFYAAELWRGQGFVIIEPERWTAQALVQAPVVLAIRLGATRPLEVATALSLSTNLMPLVLTMASLALLPDRARVWGFFPLLIFLCFSMSAAVASIADGSTAAAYAWALMLLILFAPPKPLAQATMLFLALGAVRLHEAMSFLGPLLLLAAVTRARAADTLAGRFVLITAACLIAVGTVFAVHDLLHPRLATNRGAFVSDLLSLRWLWAEGRPNALAWIGLLGLLALPLCWVPKTTIRRLLWPVVGIGFAALVLVAFLEPMTAASSFAARGNACLASLPAMALLLLARARRWPGPNRQVMAGLAALLCLAVTLADAATIWQWQRYTQAVQMVLIRHRGIIGWDAAVGSLPPAERAAFSGFAWPWTAPLMSIWLAPGGAVRGLIANPPRIAWEPFDPRILAPRLDRAAPPNRAEALRAVSGR
jgi:hypothetical protein